jgi:ribosomal protein L40E
MVVGKTPDKRLESIEKRIKALEEGLEDANNLQLLNKLDIINLVNQMDQLKLVLPRTGIPIIVRKPHITHTTKKIVKKVRVVQKAPKLPLCAKCGSVLPKGAKFCGKCGTNVKR